MKRIANLPWYFWMTTAVLLAVIATLAFLNWQTDLKLKKNSADIATLSDEIAKLAGNLDTTTKALSQDIKKIENKIAGFGETISKTEEKVGGITEELGGVKSEVGEISGSVGVLEKLAKTDPELLQKYSKVFFLNEHYEPERLVEIEQQHLYHENRIERIHVSIYPFLKDLFRDATSTGQIIYIKSAFRSFDEQSNTKDNYTVLYGAGSANQFSADQGYSEHQLGTTVDFITIGLGGALPGFDKTSAYSWLVENAYKYGFILSYPKDNPYYVFEPWHWRFVGKELAKNLRDTGKDFYDLDQREIDQYLVKIFD